MMRAWVSAALTLCAVVALGACQRSGNGLAPGGGHGASAAAAAPTGKDVRLLAVGELRDLLDKGEAVVVDVRTETQFKEGHIKGALSLPREQLAARLRELPEGKLIVSYCACPAEHLSIDAALAMKLRGRHNVAALVGGLRAWSKEGFPTE